MSLRSVTDANLIASTQNLVSQERQTLTIVLQHLREIDRRRLFSSLGYKSLFEFTTKHLGYPEDQAYRRIAAMRLIQEIPEIENKLSAGEISLSHIGLAQSHFRQEEKLEKELSREEKLEVLSQINHKSVREAERIILSMSSTPDAAKPDRIRPISSEFVEMKFTASLELQRKVETLKGLLAHKHPRLSLGELFEKLCDLALNEWDPTVTATSSKRRTENSDSQAAIRRRIFARAQNKCQNCGSTYGLEVDHIKPKAVGGSSHESNLRLLCRNCNQRAAVLVFGAKKMEPFFEFSKITTN